MNSESIHHSLQGRLTAQWRVRRRRRRGSTELLWLMRSEGDDIAVPFLPHCLAVLLLSHQHFNPSHALSHTRLNTRLCVWEGCDVPTFVRQKGVVNDKVVRPEWLQRLLAAVPSETSIRYRAELMETFVALNWGFCLFSLTIPVIRTFKRKSSTRGSMFCCLFCVVLTQLSTQLFAHTAKMSYASISIGLLAGFLYVYNNVRVLIYSYNYVCLARKKSCFMPGFISSFNITLTFLVKGEISSPFTNYITSSNIICHIIIWDPTCQTILLFFVALC